MENKSKRGGRRPGAGQPRKEPRTAQNLSRSAAELLAVWSDHIGLRKRDLIENLIFYYLDRSNSDFIYCPKCSTPCIFIPAMPPIEGKIKTWCNHCSAEIVFNEKGEILKCS